MKNYFKIFVFFLLVIASFSTSAQRNVKVIKSFQFMGTNPQSGTVLVSTDDEGNAAWEPITGACCLPDTPALNYITLTNCPTARSGVLVYDPATAQVSSSSCDTITIALDSLFANYINASNINLNGTPAQVLYYGEDGEISSDSLFLRTDTSTVILSGNYGLFLNSNTYFPISNGIGETFLSNEMAIFNGLEDLGNGEIIGVTIAASLLSNSQHSIQIDTNRVYLLAKTDLNESSPVSAISIYESDSSIVFQFSEDSYKFPQTTGTIGQAIFTDGFSPATLSFQNAPLITSGTGAPATTPIKIGDLYIDTSGLKLYFSTGTTDANDWIIAN